MQAANPPSLALAELKALSGARAANGWTVAAAAAGTAAGAVRTVIAPSANSKPVLFMRTSQVETASGWHIGVRGAVQAGGLIYFRLL